VRRSLLIANRPLPKSHPRNRPSGATPRSKRIVAVPGWLWLVAGLAGGVLIMSLVNLASSSAPAGSAAVAGKPIEKPVKPAEKSTTPVEKSRETVNKTVDDKTTPAKSATKFDFYTLLPEQEVIEPNERPATATTKTDDARRPQQPAATTSQSAPGEVFILQAGSFRSAAEADKRRAQVQALGLPSRQESVSAGGDTWYRVLVGPFPSRDAVIKARDRLAAQDIDTIIVRKKTAG
jgi:cell division protein FtsN